MERRTGRPPKATSEQKIAIVDRYFITNTDGDASRFRTYGIFRKLSEFAKIINYPLEPHDFSRDDAVRKHIDQLTDTFTQKTHCAASVPTYEPLDITALMMNGREGIEKAIRDREVYFEALHIRAAKAIEHYALVSKQCAQYREEAETVKKQNIALQEQVEKLMAELRNMMKDIAYLKRIIRRDVEPSRAQHFLAGLNSRDDIVEKTSISVMSNMNTLTREDRQIKSEVQAEINLMDLSSLFK